MNSLLDRLGEGILSLLDNLFNLNSGLAFDGPFVGSTEAFNKGSGGGAGVAAKGAGKARSKGKAKTKGQSKTAKKRTLSKTLSAQKKALKNLKNKNGARGKGLAKQIKSNTAKLNRL